VAASRNNYPNSVVFSGGEAIRRDLPLSFFLERYAESFVTEMHLFVKALLGPPGCARPGPRPAWACPPGSRDPKRRAGLKEENNGALLTFS
jgi:hypothetical protein